MSIEPASRSSTMSSSWRELDLFECTIGSSTKHLLEQFKADPVAMDSISRLAALMGIVNGHVSKADHRAVENDSR